MDSVLRVELIAAACHAAWYAYTVYALREPADAWSNASDEQKSALYHWVHFWDALPDSIDFEELCAATHLAWVNYMKRHGWTYGAEPEEKRHPSLVDYSALTEAQRGKYAALVSTYLTLRTVVPPER